MQRLTGSGRLSFVPYTTIQTMHTLPAHDGGREIDWGKTSIDYATYRPGPPEELFQRLAALRIGLPGQRLLDLGTGTGVMARQFARQGAVVSGVDVSAGQIEAARQLAIDEGLEVEFAVHPAESLPWQEPTFDVVTANQCWLYFDRSRIVDELRRVLRSDGHLVTSHFSWLPLQDPIAARTEELVLQFNPDWSAGGWQGRIPPQPKWTEDLFDVEAFFYFDVPVPFTREAWCGRIRACRGIGATLSPEEVAEFDEAHAKLLEETAPETFTVLHRVDAHIFSFRD